jgi:N-methylhydantoinase B
MATDAATIAWDGSVYPYIAPSELDIHPSLPLHTDADAVVDPVTHEVLRHALWNVNVEHGQSIIRTSGSPICAYGHDFNPAILDEEGGYVFFGKYNLYLAVSSATAVKWTLEHRSEKPGIHDGDMYLTNDPWIGTTHQPDVVIACPVFVDGRLFCWVSNTLHQWDLGGTAPGGFNPMAEDVFWEVPCYPPVKIVEDGEIRRDIEELYTRNSRLGDLVALDLRSQVTGCNVARDRILSLVERYGAATVKATMRKVQDDSATAFAKRLESIPDGTWTEEGWMEVKLPGDRGLYRNRVKLTKRDGKLIFSNEGSAPQQGALNACLAAWKGAVISMLASTMLFDQMFALEGAMRNIEFEVEPGTISCATRPAAVSGGPPTTLLHSIGMAGLVISKMLFSSSDERLREEVMSCMGVLGYPVNTISGSDQRGNPYVSFLNDPVGAALAALPWRDGQDTGGWPWDLQSTIPNVEDNELFYPIIYLWRREVADSGGAGKYRGGNGCEGAVLSHKTDRINWVTVGAEVAVPGPGLFGGYPTSTNSYRLIKGADARGFMERTGTTPTDPDELGGESDWVPAKSFDRFTERDDLWIFSWAGAGGYGDPIERDPAMTLDDVRLGRVTRGWAEQAYGVVLRGEGDDLAVDEQATEQRRADIIRARLAESTRWAGDARASDGDDDGASGSVPDGAISEAVHVQGDRFVSDGVDLGPASGNYKTHALVRELPLTDANPNLRDAALYTDHDVRFREIINPETGRLLQTEIVVDGEAPQWDLRPGR